ncbi:hypothetical protein EXIGLDRAFT_746142 [Exidia glandulosa HHB12029]|uniref:Uncharacterized protein n=1 Tax=Exidia glandulosa HHB12029 TaxID=1314781 RepID=A0A165MJ67_EXIGL|nr:hypothetical protein EXIGLDRAFT_746142 [Exidia glandulosa HHB12029]
MKALKDEKEDVKIKASGITSRRARNRSIVAHQVEEKPELLPSGPTTMIISYDQFQELEQQSNDLAVALCKLEARFAEVEAERDALKKAAKDDRIAMKGHATEVAQLRTKLRDALEVQTHLKSSKDAADALILKQRLKLEDIRAKCEGLVKSAIENKETMDKQRLKLQNAETTELHLAQRVDELVEARDELRARHANKVGTNSHAVPVPEHDSAPKLQDVAEQGRLKLEEKETTHTNQVFKIMLERNTATETANAARSGWYRAEEDLKMANIKEKDMSQTIKALTFRLKYLEDLHKTLGISDAQATAYDTATQALLDERQNFEEKHMVRCAAHRAEHEAAHRALQKRMAACVEQLQAEIIRNGNHAYAFQVVLKALDLPEFTYSASESPPGNDVRFSGSTSTWNPYSEALKIVNGVKLLRSTHKKNLEDAASASNARNVAAEARIAELEENSQSGFAVRCSDTASGSPASATKTFIRPPTALPGTSGKSVENRTLTLSTPAISPVLAGTKRKALNGPTSVSEDLAKRHCSSFDSTSVS